MFKMESIWNYAAPLTLLLVIATFRACSSDCSYPHFLHRPLPDGKTRYWVTKTEYVGSSSDWTSREHVTVNDTHILTSVRERRYCRYDEPEPCFRSQDTGEMKCYREERGYYIVQAIENGYVKYKCYKFVQRSASVVQILKSPLYDRPDSDLCADKLVNAITEGYLWISPVQEEWIACPLQGGYDFKTLEHLIKTDKCPKEWLPSRLESECVQGEGLKFYFANTNCSPFRDLDNEKRLFCWAHWDEENYKFILAGYPEEIPQFVLRLPKYTTAERFSVIMYFHALVTTDSRGLPKMITSPEIHIAELQFHKSEPGICIDETENCRELVQDGDKCELGTSTKQEVAHCMKTCALCNLLPGVNPECYFPDPMRGKWLYYYEGLLQEVTVTEGRVDFDKLGSFICKSKHWDKDYYKALSHYKNGCRHRYTCLHLTKESDNILMFRLSESSLSDLSFSICKFKDDPKPVGDIVRSHGYKMLFSDFVTKSNHCGIGGKLNAVKMLSTDLESSCKGTLSDWNENTCTRENILKLELSGSCSLEAGHHHVGIRREFICLAFIKVDAATSILLTKELSNKNEATCWVISHHSDEKGGLRPWKESKQYPMANCTQDIFGGWRSPINPQLTMGYGTGKVTEDCGGTGKTELQTAPRDANTSTLPVPMIDEVFENSASSQTPTTWSILICLASLNFTIRFL